MIRAAKFVDVPRIVELLVEMQAASKYRDISEVDERAAHALVAHCVQRNGHTTDGGALVQVVEVSGTVEGFMIGVLGRVYHIGKKLNADDAFLHCTKRAPKSAMNRLFQAYLDWAMSNPRVATIKASWTDALPGAARMGGFYTKKGFSRVGEIFERVATAPAEMELAA